MRTADIEMFSDFACPWCYITKRRLEAAIRALPADITAQILWRPSPVTPRVSRDAAAEDFLMALGAAEGIEFAFDRVAGIPDTFDAHRLIWLADEDRERADVVDVLVERIYRAQLSEGQDIGNPVTLAAIGREVGLDAERTERWLAGHYGVEEVRALQRRAADMGIDTIPFMLINGRVGIRGSRSGRHLLQTIQGASWFGLDRPGRLAARRQRKTRRSAERERHAVEALIDDILMDSFPASDAPAWDSAAERIRNTKLR